MEQKTFIRIPGDRIGVLIGADGKTRRRIESAFGVKITVESESGGVTVKVNEDQPDVSVMFTVKNIVKAIGRGFNPKKAMTLQDEDNDLIVIDLEEFVGTSKNAQNRVRGRIIGKEGKSRELLEELTNCLVSVYGGTVAVIGPYEMLQVAKEAVEMLLNGSYHKTVWNHLYAYRRKMRKEKGELWYEPARRRT
ncbi:RNA-processing protein [Candidatus Bathyarchaeota archaeon]|nr:RNA-processing protein [Candidatus Bathyarchaeota archaeon]MBT4319087.1 RNA-processing protein [Candidatus Bathyarchaeota archaeon]MBT4424337.1 RNA-processing protein [Candidatus Bathyarchaeota archaeon]MBT5641647.1 RNA-processing protein [Candidatus Bathyarchaeota archaeon]MBT6604667.1 RNA-processing protein [Candidatus Bathyarchaeota archaeon]